MVNGVHDVFVISVQFRINNPATLGVGLLTYKLDSILPMAGLHISQPMDSLLTPTSCIIRGKFRSFLTRTTLNKSALVMAKCGQRLVFSLWPAFFISKLKMLVT